MPYNEGFHLYSVARVAECWAPRAYIPTSIAKKRLNEKEKIGGQNQQQQTGLDRKETDRNLQKWKETTITNRNGQKQKETDKNLQKLT